MSLPRATGIMGLSVVIVLLSACSPSVPGATKPPPMGMIELLTGAVWWLVAGALVIGVVAVLGLLAFLAFGCVMTVGHSISDRIEGECDDCRKKRKERQDESDAELRRAEQIIRDHDRTGPKPWRDRHG